MLDPRDRFKSFINLKGLDQAIKLTFPKIKKIRDCFPEEIGREEFVTLTSGGVKAQGQTPDRGYILSDKPNEILNHFYYHDLFSWLNELEAMRDNRNVELVWRKRPEAKIHQEDPMILFSVFSRLQINLLY